MGGTGWTGGDGQGAGSGGGGIKRIDKNNARHCARTICNRRPFEERGNVTAEAQDLRVLCVDHGHREGLGHLVTVNVFRFVENLSGTHGEGRTAVVTAGDIDEITVVGDRRLVPGHDCSAITGVIVDGEITGQAADDRAFLVIDGHVEGSTGRVAVDIDGREGHGFGSHFEVGSADMRLGEGLDFAVVLFKTRIRFFLACLNELLKLLR